MATFQVDGEGFLIRKCLTYKFQLRKNLLTQRKSTKTSVVISFVVYGKKEILFLNYAPFNYFKEIVKKNTPKSAK